MKVNSRKIVAVNEDEPLTPTRASFKGRISFGRQKKSLTPTNTEQDKTKVPGRLVRHQTAVAQSANLFEKKMAPEHADLMDRLWYTRDCMFEKQWTRYLLLLLTFLTVLVLMACLHMLNKLEERSIAGEAGAEDGAQENVFLPHLWIAWTYMADPGTHADVGSSLDKSIAVTISVMGILFFSTGSVACTHFPTSYQLTCNLTFHSAWFRGRWYPKYA